MAEAMQAINRGDERAFRACFDPLPTAKFAAFMQTIPSRYGKFQKVTQLTPWSEPQARHMNSATFQLVFDKATLTADVTIRPMVEEASASGDTSYLGQTRIARIHIHDSANGDLIFP